MYKRKSRKLSGNNSLQCQGIGIVEEYSWCKHNYRSMQWLWISHSFHHFWEAPEWWRRLDRSEHPLHWKLSRTPLNLPSSLPSTSALLSLSLSAPNTDKFSLSSEWIRMILIYTHIHYLLSSSFSATMIITCLIISSSSSFLLLDSKFENLTAVQRSCLSSSIHLYTYIHVEHIPFLDNWF